MAPVFVYNAFIFTYGMKVVGASRDFLLVVLLIASFMSFFTIPFSGYLSDRLGRKQVYIFGAVTTGLFAFAYFAMLDTAIPSLIILASLIAFAFHDLMWGPLAALTAECFTPRLRYSGDVDRLSARRGVRWRAGAADRDGDTRIDRIGPDDRALHLWLHARHHCRDDLPAEQPGPGFRPRSPLTSPHPSLPRVRGREGCGGYCAAAARGWAALAAGRCALRKART